MLVLVARVGVVASDEPVQIDACAVFWGADERTCRWPQLGQMSHELEQFWISIYELCLTAELAHLSIEIRTNAGVRTVGVPTISAKVNPGWLEDESKCAPPVIEIDDQPIAIDQVIACAVFAPDAAR